MFHPKIENAEFISRVEHLLSKVGRFLPKPKHITISDVGVYRTNRKQFCLKEHIESKTLGTKVSQNQNHINFKRCTKNKNFNILTDLIN